MEPFRRIAIVGVGLIGGSLALALRRAGLVREVVGIGRTQQNLDVALARGIVDRAGTDAALAADCELVVLATPGALLAPSAAAVAPHLAPGTIVTDAGSVKAGVVRDCTAALAGRARFVGAHPIAGTESSGAAAAEADLFRGARCVLTPVADTDPDALARVRALWEAVGMDVVEMAPEAHDELLALTSHVPHLLAFALTGAAAAFRDARGGAPDPFAFAGPSFRDATRVAASSPEMWRDILLANAGAVRAALRDVRGRLDALDAAIAAGDAAGIVALVGAARAAKRAAAEAAKPDVVTVAPAAGPLRGAVSVPGDKSIAHRALLFGGLAEGTTVIRGVGHGEDNRSTMSVLRALGVDVVREGGEVRVTGRGFAGLRAPAGVLDCGNSGTTMRLLTGILAGAPFDATLDGDASLRKRPMRRVVEPLSRMGAAIDTTDGRPPVTVHGRPLRPAQFVLNVASAQVKTALVLAGLHTDGRTVVEEPGASRDHTERLLPAFGATVERPRANVVAVTGPQKLRACTVDVPGDPSAAAFWLVAASIVPGSRVVIRGMSVNPTRTGAVDVMRAMGARITERPVPSQGDEPVADIEVEAAALHGTVVAGDAMLRAIDEFPVLAVAAAAADGVTRFADGAELRVKESDRIAAMATGLRALGISVEESEDGMVVHGGRLGGGTVESHADHRIAMAFVVAALVAAAPVTIRGADAIAVSDPGFLLTLATLRRGGTDVRTGSADQEGRNRHGVPSDVPRRPVVTIDGPAGAGKSTVSRTVAERLGFTYLDTGALYRAVALAAGDDAALAARIDAAPATADLAGATEQHLAALARALPLAFSANGTKLAIGDRDVSVAIRAPEISQRASKISALPAIRAALLDVQRRIGAAGGVVAEGRDTGSVVFPDAEVKIFLTAEVAERARRRAAELRARGIDADDAAVQSEIESRDARDAAREAAPLTCPEGALVLDSSALPVDAVVRLVLDAVTTRQRS